MLKSPEQTPLALTQRVRAGACAVRPAPTARLAAGARSSVATAWLGRAGPGRAGPGRAGPGRAGPGRAGPGRAAHTEIFPLTQRELASRFALARNKLIIDR